MKNDKKSELKQLGQHAEKWFGKAPDKIKRVHLPNLKGAVLEMGQVGLIQYQVNEKCGPKRYHHVFGANKAYIYTKPGASWLLVTGKFKFNSERGLLNT